MPSTAAPTLLSAGPVLLSPEVAADGTTVLFAADVAAATVVAFELPPEQPAAADAEVHVERLGARLASLLGVDPQDAVVRGMTVHPVSHDVLLSVARGRGGQAASAIVRVGTDGEVSLLEVDDLPSTRFALDDAPAADDDRTDVWLDGHEPTSQRREFHGVSLDFAQVPSRRSAITGLAWVDGALYVAGLSNEEFSSRLRRIAYPFTDAATETSVQIFHVDHGRYETESPVRALTSFGNGTSVLATYTCTPVVRFDVEQLRGGGLVRGRTVAELGPMNQPFSIVSYERDGEEFLLVSNTRHPLLKIPAASIATQEHLDVPIAEEGASRGVPREELDHPGVTWMASIDRGSVAVLQEEDGDVHLRTLHAESL